MGQTPLDREWWGGVLGYCGDGYMQETHVRAWCNKLIQDRETKYRRGTSSSNTFRWTILPPNFIDLLAEQDNDAYGYATGSVELYPPFWDVDTVYIPVSKEKEGWVILKIDMHSLKITVYFTNKCDALNCGERFCIHRRIHQILVEFESLFLWFLGRIQYWENAGLSEADALDYTGDVVWPTSEHRVGRNSGVILCMLLQNLVQNSVLPNWQERNMQDACMRYRRFMADQLYSARFIPH
ncbi:hypothetical protein HanHA300_Chr14g0541511 [Helianthus annuus]|nr:hypothetical protein HanHA300_Chr14g0541511 [Helianthus annuus]KAJ0678138.1 hypothetical protein HanOQP8_Chr12g0444491 [Helianthus annuus]